MTATSSLAALALILCLPSFAVAKPGSTRNVEQCQYGPLLRSDEVLNTGDIRSDTQGNAFIEQLPSGSMQIVTGTPSQPGTVLWKSKALYSTSPNFRTVLQRDSHLITRIIDDDDRDDIVFKTETVQPPNRDFYFGLNCDGTSVVIAKPNNNGKDTVIWNQPTIPNLDDPIEPSSRNHVVLRQNEVIVSSRTSKVSSESECSYRFQTNGVVKTYRKYAMSSWENTWASTRAASEERLYTWRLNEDDGSLETIYTDESGNEQIFHSTNNPPNAFPNSEKNFQLVITPECVLQIIQDQTHVVWSNNGFGFSMGQFLQRGEMFHTDLCAPFGKSCPQTLMLQRDCNLVLFAGMDPLDLSFYREKISWSSNTGGNMDDCYLYAAPEGPQLYQGPMNRSNPTKGKLLWQTGRNGSGRDGYSIYLDSSGKGPIVL